MTSKQRSRIFAKKLGETPHPSVLPQPPITSDEQFACDFEHAQIASFGGLPHHDQPGIGTSLSMWDAPPPNTFSLRGRVQGTMFPNFDGTEYPYRVLHFGQGNDSISTAVRGTYPQSVPETPRIVLTARRGLPLWKKGKRGCPKLPLGAPSIYAPVDDWNQSDDCDKSFELPRMFPRALGSSLCPDNDEAEGPSGVCWVAPANGTPVPWEGEFTCSATLADVTTYLVANGVTYHNANNALNNGGDKDPNTKVIINQMRATLNELLPMGEHHSLQWIDLQACVLGVLPENIMPYKACPIKERDLFALEEFTKLAALYDLSHQTRGEGSNTGGVVPIPASTLKEGEMEDDLRPM
ncbi:hypothetical protein EDC04DRAFT_2614921 [Pisolithus marmoratus]|nr:hypothetical protein EDC04DRAFT_2614921 [Pisolithus marmoratus]